MTRIYVPSLLLLLLALVGCSDSQRRFRQTSTSMSPTIQPNEVVVADMAAYQKAVPSRWDIIVFHPTPAPGNVAQEFWVMRVIALPNEQLEFRDDGIYINEQLQEPPARLSGIRYIAPRHSPSISYPYRVPADSYFLLGDNTTNALDSRYWGALPREDILGRVKDK